MGKAAWRIVCENYISTAYPSEAAAKTALARMVKNSANPCLADHRVAFTEKR